MIALLVLAQALPSPPAPVLAPLGRQQLPASGCAAYLWSTGPDHRLVAMASAEPATLRLALDGAAAADIARSAAHGDAGFGLAATSEYRVGDLVATLDLTILTRGEITDGAVVPQGTLRIDRPGRDGVVMPVAGIVGCAA